MDEEAGQNLFSQIMEIWIVPEVRRRQQEGSIGEPFELRRAQVLFSPLEKEPLVRLNEEIRAKGELKVREPRCFKAGEIIYEQDVEDVVHLGLLEDELDCGHVTLISHGSQWTISFDFTYNRQSALTLIEKASEFVESAAFCYENGKWTAFVDNCFSAVELIAKSDLITHFQPRMVKESTHKKIKSQYNLLSKIRWTGGECAQTLNRLSNLRTEARYSASLISIEPEEANSLLAMVRSMFEESQGRKIIITDSNDSAPSGSGA